MAQMPDAQIELEIKPMKWEYLTYFLGTESPKSTQQNSLDRLGGLGWELVTVVVINGDMAYLAYFKRPVWKPE